MLNGEAIGDRYRIPILLQPSVAAAFRPAYTVPFVVVAHKNIRLPAGHYRGCRCYFVTACCASRRPIFADPARARWLVDWLSRMSEPYRMAVHAYCVMPDHVHALIEGLDPNTDLLLFMKELKQRTGYEYRRESGGPLWQKKFYDYVLRPKDSPDSVAAYIWLNPVRKGLCSRAEDFPFSGSLTLPWPPAQQQTVWIPSWKKSQPT